MNKRARALPLFTLGLISFLFIGGYDDRGVGIPVKRLRAERRHELPRMDLDLRTGSKTATDSKDADELDAFISQFMESKKIPGLTGALVKNGEIIWTGAFGHAYFAPPTPAHEDHLFMLASVTKTVTGCALMTLHDQGAFGLDDAVNDYLPFVVKHPLHPNIDVTFRMLLTHTSAIRDNWGVMPYYPGDSPVPLGDYLLNYLTPGGAYYHPQDNFYSWAPGTNDGYCNIALALAGYLVEVLSGLPLEDYCQNHLFTPLGMDNTSYFLANLDTRDIAMPYFWNGTNHQAYGHYGYSDYPSGQLRTSAPQLMKFLAAFMRDHFPVDTPDSVRLIEWDTAVMMTTPQVPGINPSQGLVWYNWKFNGRSLWGHGGGDQGVTTEMWYWPEESIGLAVLTNGEAFFFPVLEELFQFAERY